MGLAINMNKVNYKVFPIILFYIFVTEFLLNILEQFLSQTTSSLIFAALQILICISFIYLLRSNFKDDLNHLFRSFKAIYIIPIFVVLDLAYQIIIQNIIPANPSNQSGLEKGVHSSGSIGVLILFILIAITGPIVEEVIFQYFIQHTLLKGFLSRFNLSRKAIAIISIVITTILFMMFHVNKLRDIQNISFLQYSDLIFFAIIYEYSDDNLMYPILMHIISNIIGFISIL